MLQEPQPHGIERYVGTDLYSSDGEKLGSVNEFIYNRISEVAEWIVVGTGLLRSNLLVPIAGCSFEEGRVVVPYESGMIQEAPEMADVHAITPEEEDRLDAHFGLGAEQAPG